MKEEEAIEQILKACTTLGWALSFEEDAGFVKGMVLGEPDYVDKVVDAVEALKN